MSSEKEISQPASESGSGATAYTSNAFASPNPSNDTSSTSSLHLRIDDQDKKIKDVISVTDEARKATQEVRSALTVINNIVIGVLVVFVVTLVMLWADYSHNLDEERRYFNEILRGYQTKQDFDEEIKKFKRCVYSYGFNVCTKNI
jgi:ribosomal protein L6P/L9E